VTIADGNPAGPYAVLSAAKDAGAVTLRYGLFINAVISFLIVAFALFLVIRSMNKLRREAPAAAPNTKECKFCCSTIPLNATRCPSCTSQLA
jgi:large conductance mechanosensitive channel